MSDKDKEIYRLQQKIETLVLQHNEQVTELKDEIRSLKSELKIKRRAENVAHAEYTLKYFPAAIIRLLEFVDPSQLLANLYVKSVSFWNYMVVGMVGVGINMIVIHRLINFLPLWLANSGAIFIAWSWNWCFSVGPLGYLFGLSPKKKDRVVEL